MQRRILGTALVTLICLAFVLHDLDLDAARDALATYDWRRVPLVLGLYAVSLAFRAERVRRLLPTPVAYGRVFLIVGASHLASNVFPLHAGVLVAPYLLATTHDVPFGEGVAVAVMERVLDAMALLVLVGIAVFSWQAPTSASAGDVALLTGGAQALVVGVVAALLGLVALALLGRTGVDFATRATARVAPRLAPSVERVSGRFVDTVRTLRARPIGALGALLGTLGWWTASLCAGAVTMGGFPTLPSTTLPMVVVNQIAIVTGGTLLPSPGHVGGFEAGAIGAMTWFGADPSVARVFALVLHGSQLTFTVVAGSACFAIAGWRMRSVVGQATRAV